LAGVTLLAIANGAGDVITAIVASGTSTGISYNIGSLYGAGLFCTSLVIAFTIYLSPTDIKISHNIIYRDVGFYLAATLLTYLFAGM
jgi:sodium/potassium/calcium exchanger 6